MNLLGFTIFTLILGSAVFINTQHAAHSIASNKFGTIVYRFFRFKFIFYMYDLATNESSGDSSTSTTGTNSSNNLSTVIVGMEAVRFRFC